MDAGFSGRVSPGMVAPCPGRQFHAAELYVGKSGLPVTGVRTDRN